MQTLDLPQEISDLFIDEINSTFKQQERLDALRSCQLVSRAFYLRSRVHLWSESTLLNRKIKDAALHLQILKDILGYSSPLYPTVASYIRRFSINFPRSSLIKQKTSEVMSNECLPAIIDLLHGSDYGIEVFYLSILKGEITWEGLSMDLKQSLDRLFHSPRLKSLLVEGCRRLPLSAFEGTRIQELQLVSINPRPLFWGPPTQPTPDPKEFLFNPPPLERFSTDLTFVFPTSQWMRLILDGSDTAVPPSPLANLRHLKISFETLNSMWVFIAQEVLDDCLKSLNHLEICILGKTLFFLRRMHSPSNL